MGLLQRRFLGWDRPILHSAADWLVAAGRERGRGGVDGVDAVDLSHLLLVLPGGRAGRRLLELLLVRCEALRVPLLPPRIVGIGDLPEELYLPVRPAPPPLVETLAWAAAIAETEQSGVDLSPFLPVQSDGRGGRRRDALATTLRSLSHEVGSAAVDFSEVALRCRTSPLFSDEGRWKTLAEIERRYRAILLRGGFQDRSDARRASLAADAIHSDREVVLIGAPDLTPLVRSFLDLLSRQSSVEVWVGAPETFAGHFDSMGCVLPEVWKEEQGIVPDHAIRILAGPASQADAVVEELANLGGRFPAEEISIGVPDTGLIPWIEERLEEAGVPVRYGGGAAIESTPTYRLLEAIAHYLQARDYDSFAALVRHPHLEGKLRKGPGAPSSEGIPTLLDRYQREHLQSRIDAGVLPRGSGGQSQEVAASIHEARDSLLELLSPLDRIRAHSEWRQVLAEFLLAVYGARPLRREVEWERTLIEITKRIGRVLSDLESIPKELAGSMSGERVIRVLLSELRGGTIPPAAEEGAVELLGWLELPLDDAEVLIVTGVNEPHLPESVTADPFLPHSLRQELGLLDNPGRWARDLFHLRTILAIRPNTLFLSGRRDAEGVVLLPSRLLLAEEVAVVSHRMVTFLGDGVEGDGVEGNGVEVDEGMENGGDDVILAPSTGASAASANGATAGGRSGAPSPARFLLPPEPLLTGFPVPEKVRVTDFGRVLKDPYRYALERKLGLEEEDDRLRELDPMGFGSLAHTVLERFGSAATPVMDARGIRAHLNEILDKEVRVRFGTRPLPALRLQVEQLRFRLGAFADRQAEWMQEGWRIEGVELDAAGEEAVLVVDGAPIRLGGKIDRIDRNEVTGTWRLLDYKTGESGETPEKVHRRGRAKVKEWVDFQLPLYRFLAPALRRRDGTRLLPEFSTPQIEVGYLLLPRDPAGVRIEIAPWSEEEVDEAIERARDLVRFLRAGVFAFDRERSSIRKDDPLAPVIGGGVLLLEESDESGESSGEAADV